MLCVLWLFGVWFGLLRWLWLWCIQMWSIRGIGQDRWACHHRYSTSSPPPQTFFCFLLIRLNVPSFPHDKKCKYFKRRHFRKILNSQPTSQNQSPPSKSNLKKKSSSIPSPCLSSSPPVLMAGQWQALAPMLALRTLVALVFNAGLLDRPRWP